MSSYGTHFGSYVIRNLQLPRVVAGDGRRSCTLSSTVNIQPLLGAPPLCQSSTSWVTFNTTSSFTVHLAEIVGRSERSDAPARPPGCVHSTFFGRIMRYWWHTPTPHSPSTRQT